MYTTKNIHVMTFVGWFCYVEILRKFKASKVNSLQSEGIQQKKKKRETHLIRANVCFITPYGAVVLPFLLVTTANLDMKTIPEWMHGLTLYLAMSCSTVNASVYSILNQKIKSSFLNIVGKSFRTRNHAMTESNKKM